LIQINGSLSTEIKIKPLKNAGGILKNESCDKLLNKVTIFIYFGLNNAPYSNQY
tara:strand:- start:455 stop:616 length:162 start_codon:yes stop_codon:yes gene_type:complete